MSNKPGSGVLTSEEVLFRLNEAATTMMRLPIGVVSPDDVARWPAEVQKRWRGFCADPAQVRIAPSAELVSRWEEVLTWLPLIEDVTGRRIVWLRAEGLPWRAVCARVGLSRSQAHRRWAAAVDALCRALAAQSGKRGRGNPDGGRAPSASGKPGRGGRAEQGGAKGSAR